MRLVLSYLALVLLAGCPDRTVAELPPVQAGEVLKDIPVSVDIDLLFVIDNSGSTRDKQTVFAANFPRFVQALDAFPEGRPNLHIGVVSTTVDLGVSGIGGCPHPAPLDDGLLHNTPSGACAAPSGRFLLDVATPGGGRQTNYTGKLDDALSCIAQLGDAGCGFEAPLEAMKRALDGRRPENAGFLRKGAFLVIVFLVDEDDASIGDPAFFAGPPQTSDFRAQPLFAYQCDQPISATAGGHYTNCRVRTDSFLTPPASYFELLSTVTPPGRAVVALIGGDPRADISTGPLMLPNGTQPLALQPTCQATINGNVAIGRPAIRLMDFVSRFGERGLFRTVCQPDYSQALADIGKLIGTAVSPCLEGTLDTSDVDDDNPGTQLQCNVSDVQLAPVEVETPIPRCEMQDATHPRAGDRRPCWWTGPNPAACGSTPTQLELHIERTSPAAPGTSVRVRCATG
ncbi:MAG TPA: hypothetical protein VN253_11285 [Kofleriaceae bacterium]|nr:hypothetical protein [Kofleriaceae bacterium]